MISLAVIEGCLIRPCPFPLLSIWRKNPTYVMSFGSLRDRQDDIKYYYIIRNHIYSFNGAHVHSLHHDGHDDDDDEI